MIVKKSNALTGLKRESLEAKAMRAACGHAHIATLYGDAIVEKDTIALLREGFNVCCVLDNNLSWKWMKSSLTGWGCAVRVSRSANTKHARVSVPKCREEVAGDVFDKKVRK